MFKYSIYITPFDYNVALNVTAAKVVWDKDENGVIFRKRLDGTFSFNRSNNESIFDRIMAFTYCDKGILTCTDSANNIIQYHILICLICSLLHLLTSSLLKLL